MESQAEWRRIDPAHTAASGNTWSSAGLPHRHLQLQSSLSDFTGTGVSNNNGNFNVGGNLYLNDGNIADTKITVEQKRKGLLDSLRFEQMESRQLSIKKAHEDTCRWFLTAPAYTQWEKKASSKETGNLLWIKGKPGAGKSTLMNYLDKQLRSRLREKGDPCVFLSFFFHARGSDLERSIEGMYRSLLLQLLEARPELQHVLDRLRSVPKWDVSLLKHLFEQAAEESTTTICLIDALDECQEDDIRDMVNSFESVLRAGSQLHVCFASRHYPYISTHMGLSIILEEQDQHENDISSYLNTKLEIGHSRQARDIRLEMRKKASGVFMWVVLVVEMLNKEYDKGKIHNLRRRLKELPGDLHELFRSILARDKEDRDELLLCIQWVLFAKRPLTPKELYFAIISGSDPQSLLDYHSDEISESDIKRFILNSSKGLTESIHEGYQSSVQFIHESVRDFLLKGDNLHRVFPELPTNIVGSSHETLRTCCLSYVQMARAFSFGEDEDTKFPFRRYAANQILHHANQADSNGLNQQAFLAEFPHKIWPQNHDLSLRRIDDSRPSMLNFCAQMGLTSLVDKIPNIQSCFEQEDALLRSPIICAMTLGNFECAQEMLRVQAKRFPCFCYEKFNKLWSPVLNISDGVEPFVVKNFPILRDTSKLIEIIRYGSELISIFFLQTESVDVDAKGVFGWTAVMVAAQKGYLYLLKELHRQGANFEARRSSGFTALHLAARNCSLRVVEQLLDCGADASDALSVVEPDSETDSIKVAKLLIENGASVLSTDSDGKTPLHRFSQFKFGYDTARLLLDRGADVAAVDKHGKTPLHYCDSIETSELLLDHNARISAIDASGNTPLHYAANENAPYLCQLLLDRGADPMAPNKSGQIPFDMIPSLSKIGCWTLEEYVKQ